MAQAEELVVPSAEPLATLLSKLNVKDDDAAEVIRSMPLSEHDPELWWLLERSR